jgi:hypothetical protein
VLQIHRKTRETLFPHAHCGTELSVATQKRYGHGKIALCTRVGTDAYFPT